MELNKDNHRRSRLIGGRSELTEATEAGETAGSVQTENPTQK